MNKLRPIIKVISYLTSVVVMTVLTFLSVALMQVGHIGWGMFLVVFTIFSFIMHMEYLDSLRKL